MPKFCIHSQFRPRGLSGPRGESNRAAAKTAVLILVGPAYQRHIPYGKVEALQVLESGGSRSIRIQLPADNAFRRGPPDCLGDLCQNENCWTATGALYIYNKK